MSEPMQRLAQVLLVSVASGLVLGATVPKVAIQRDPTRPPSFTSAPGEAPTLFGGGGSVSTSANRLTTTVVAADASFAVIDGQRVEEGDFVAGARVVKIDPASVKLRGVSGPYELRFYSLPVKVEPGSMAELSARVAPGVKVDTDVKFEPAAQAGPDTEAELEGEIEPSAGVEPGIYAEHDPAADAGVETEPAVQTEPGVETEPAVETESSVEAVPASDAPGPPFDE